MRDLPTGTVTFLFTDLEGSTRAWEEQPEAMPAALARHDAILRDAMGSHQGLAFSEMGDGIAAAFASARDAVAAALEAQLGLGAEEWGEIGGLRARMGLHASVAELRSDGRYVNQPLNRCARLMAVAHGGQLVVSETVESLVRGALPPDVGLLDLGVHRLRDLARPIGVFQVTHPGLRREFPPLRSLDVLPGNLPVVRTPLVGRQREVGEVAGLLESDRLVTLTGVGGVGKTRLALQVAAEVLDRFPEGVWLVGLAPIRDAALVPDAVAAAVGVRDQPGRSLVEVLCEALERRRLLLVLDNCEHVTSAVAEIADRLLDSCSELRLLATSREALGVAGEYRWPTPSLAVAGEVVRDPAALVEVEAVQLFVERAQAVRRDFAVSIENAAAVAEICERLDGIPLAIELAAARVSVLGPQDILARLDERFRLLTGGSRTALERHQTLRAAVEWSYALLDEGERQLYRRSSIFSGGFDLAAVEAVAIGDAVEQSGVLDLLSGLIAKSMIMTEPTGNSARYRILETLREYGRDRLIDSGESDTIRTRHARYYVDLAETLFDEMVRRGTRDPYSALERELDNLRVAHDWLIAIGDAPTALRWIAACPLARVGERAEMLRRCETTLAMCEALPPQDRARALMISGWVAFESAEHARARELSQACLDLLETSGLPPDPMALATLAQVAFWSGDARRAIKLTEESIANGGAVVGGGAMNPTLGDSRGMLCFTLTQIGENDRAIAIGEAFLAETRPVGHANEANALWLLALAYLPVDLQRAHALVEESLARYASLGGYANVWAFVAAGQVRTAAHEYRGAIEVFARATEVSQATGDRQVVPVSLEGMARAFRGLGNLLPAVRLFGAAEAAREHLGVAGAVAEAASRDRAIANLKAGVPDEDFTGAWQHGRNLRFDATIALALGEAAAIAGDSASEAVA